jgi:DNA mismatch endonuclease (patch repair protein)
MHSCKFGSPTPATNSEFWAEKRQKTVIRDARNHAALTAMGWSVMTVWECELRDFGVVEQRLTNFLSD